MFPSQRGDYIWRLTNSRRSLIIPGSRAFENDRRIRSPPIPLGATASRLHTSQIKSGGIFDKQSVRMVESKNFLEIKHPSPQAVTSNAVAQNLQYVSRKLRTLPSTWSNNQIKFQFEPQPWNAFNDGGNSVIDSEIYLHCADITGNVILTSKTEEERTLFTRICKEALKNRRQAQIFYADLYENDLQQSQNRLKNFNPENHRGELCNLMLKLVIERDRLLNDMNLGKSINKMKRTRKMPREFSEEKSNTYVPVYSIAGKTFLAKATDSLLFPNTFAELNSLLNPRDDPPEFLRYSTIVDMRGFEDGELLFRAKGQTLAIDGYKVRTSEKENEKPSVRVVTDYVDLPSGVYPDRLLIGRSYSGILVIQEPWKF